MAGELVSASSDGATSGYAWDRLGLPRYITDATGVRRYSLYDAENRKVADVDADGSVVEYRYDAGNRLVATIAWATPVASATVAGLANLAANPGIADLGLQASAADRWTWSIYDKAGRLVQTIDAAGAVTAFEYDGANRLVRTTAYATGVDVSALKAAAPSAPVAAVASAGDRVARNFYDADGLLVAALDGEGAITEFAYDGAGRKIRTLAHAALIDPALRAGGSLAALLASVPKDLSAASKDVAQYWLYDGRGLVVATVDGEGQVARYGYDARGDVVSEQHGAKLAAAQMLALLGQAAPTGATIAAAVNAATGPVIETTGYTRRDDGQVLSMVRQLAGGNSETTAFQYDALGRLVAKTVTDTLAGESRGAVNRYDARGRLIGTVAGEGAAALAALGAAPSEAQLDTLYQTWGTRYFYDNADRLVATSQGDGSAASALQRNVFYYDTDGNLRFAINAAGEVTEHRFNTFDQDAQTIVHGGRLTAAELATLAGGLVDSAVTAAMARLTGDTAGTASTIATAYDARGQAVSVTDAGGFATTFQYNAFGQLVRSDAPSDAAGGTVDTALYGYDRRGLKVSEQHLLGGTSIGALVSSFGYDAFGRLTSQATNADGRHFTYAYDRDSRLVSSTDRTGAVESFQYDARGNRIVHVDRSGRTTQFAYDLFNRTVTTTTQEGVVATVTRNAQGQTIRIEDGAHRVTTYTYDKSGQLRFATDAAGTSETRYDTASRVLDTIDARGVRTHYTYDAVGRTLTRTDNADGVLGAPPVTTTWEYDAKGQQIAVTDALGTITRFEYDLRGNKVRVVADAGGLAIETRYVYGPAGKVVSMVEAWGTAQARTTTYGYDTLGRLVQTVEDQGGLNIGSAFTWDDNGNMVASTDALGRVTRFVYDAENRQVMSVNAEGEVVETGYDGEGRAIWTQAYANRIATATLDAQPLALTAAQVHALAPASGDDRVALSAYDGDGRLAYAVDAEGYVTGNGYDAANNLIATTRYGAKIAAAKGESAASITGKLAAAPSADTATTSYAYDGANRLWRITDANQVVTRYVLDALGQIVETHVADTTADEAVTTRQFDALGRVLQETRAAGETYAATVHYAYDALGRATDITDARGAVTHRDYDRLGRLTLERRPLDATHDAVTQYAYDARGNVVAVRDARGNWSWNYYDGADRLVLQVDQEGYATATAYRATGAVDSVTRYANRVIGAGNPAVRPTLDPAAGDATSHFVRDRLDRVTAAVDALGQAESYQLDAFGQRTAVTNKLGGVTHYTYDRRGLVLSEAVDASADGSSPAFVKATYEYDSRGNLKTQVEAPGLGGGRITRFEYDKLDRLVHKILPAVDGQTLLPEETYDYDARGNLIHAKDAVGAEVRSWYDDLGRKIAEVSASDSYTTWDYDANGNVVGQKVYAALWNGTPPSAAQGLRETRFEYDKANRQISAQVLNVQTGRLQGGSYVLGGGAQGITTGKEYDAAGNVVRETDGNGGQTVHFYDKLGRELAKVDPAGFVTTWSRDTNGNVLTEVRHAVAVALPVDPLGTAPVPAFSPNNRETRFEYDANGRRVKLLRIGLDNVMDGASGTLAQGVTSEVDYAYNGFDEVVSKTEAHAQGQAGDVTDYAYDQFGRLVRQSDAAFVDWRGATVRKVTSYVYDALNNVVQTVESASDGSESRTTSYDYVNGRLSQVHDAGGYDRAYAYDLGGRLIRESWTRRDSQWDAANPSAHAFEEANVTQYDDAGRVVRSFKAVKQGADWVQPAGGMATVMAYNAFGELVSRALAAAGDATGQVQESLVYDNAGRVIATNGGDGSWKLVGYDANGNATITITAQTGSLQGQDVYGVVAALGDVANLSDAGHIITLSRYDARNMATATIEPNRAAAVNINDVVSSAAWKIERFRTYNAFGEVTSEIDARGNATTYGYNAMGRLVAKFGPAIDVTDEHGGTTHVATVERYFYDAAGRLTAVDDANGNRTRRALVAGTGHGEGEPLVATEYRADGSIWEVGYDVFGQKRSETQGYFAGDAARLTTHYAYDGLGRLTQITRPSGVSESFAYDVLGQRIKRWNSVQTAPIYDYDNPIYYTDPWNETDFFVGYPIIGYEPLVERTDYDIEGRVTAVTTIGGDTTLTTYAWDAGRITSGTGTAGAWVKTISYGTGLSEIEVSDSFGHMQSRKNQGNFWFTNTYNAAGQLIQQHGDSNGSDVAYSYDLSGRVTGLTQIAQSMTAPGWGTGYYGYLGGYYWNYTVQSQVTQKAAYLYDADGNRLSENTWTETQSYTYDWINSGWVAGGSPVLQTLQKATARFDGANRMTRFHDTGEGGMGQVTIDNAYDANGNVRRTRTEYQAFDTLGNLSAATSVEDDWYRYDALNRFTVVKGSLVGLAGTSAAYIDIGSLGRGIEYNAAGQRAAMITQTVELPYGYDPGTFGDQGGYIGAGYTAYQQSLGGTQAYSFIGSSFDSGGTTFLASAMMVDQQLVDNGDGGGGGGGVSFPYYDTALQGTWYLAADGVTSYLALGDSGGAAGTHGNLTIPGALNTYDAASAGTWSFVANGTDGWGSPTGYYTVSFSTQGATDTGGGTSTGGTGYPYYDSAFNGTVYLAADGTTSYIVYGDSAGSAGTYGGLTPTNVNGGPDPVTGAQWYYDVYDYTSGIVTLLVYEPGSGSGTGGTGGGGTVTYPWYDSAKGGMFYQATGSGEVYFVLGDTTSDNTDWSWLQPPGSYPQTYTIDLTQAGYGIWNVGTWYADSAGYPRFEPTNGSGGGTGGTTYPYYDATAGGTFYQSTSGAAYLVLGDSGGASGTHGGLTLPASYPSYDAAAGGTWTMGASGYPVLTPGGAPVTYPYYDAAKNGTFYQAASSGEIYFVLGDTATDNADWSWITPPGSYPQAYTLDLTAIGGGYVTLGTWYADPAGYPRFEPTNGSGGGTTYPYYDAAAGGTFYQSTSGAAYLVLGDTGGASGTHGGLTIPEIYGNYDPAAGGTWSLSQSGYFVLTLGVPVTYPYYDAAKNGTFYESATTGQVFFVQNDTPGDQADWSFLEPPATYPFTWTIDLGEFGGVITIGTWYADPAGYPKFVPGDTGGGTGGTTYPWYDASSGGTWYQNGAAIYLVQGDASGGTAAYQGLIPPATVPQYSTAAGGTWYANGARYTFVPGDRTGGYPPTYDAALGGTWYKAADSQELYLWQGDGQPVPAHEGLSLPASYPLHDDALGGTWSQVINYDPYNLSTTIVFTPDPSYPYFDAQVGGTRYLAADGSGYLVVGDYSGSLGAYAGIAPPAARPSFDALGRGVWLDNAPLGLRLVLGAASYYDAAANWTVLRGASGALYRISGDVTAQPYYTAMTPPATLPAWDAAAYGTWYADSTGAGLGPILMIGDFTMAPMTVNRTRESYEYDADGYLIAVRASQQTLSRTAGVDTLVYAGPESLTATTSYDGLGRITDYAEYSFGQVAYHRYGIVYNARGQVYSEASILKRGADTFYGSVTNRYNLVSGLLELSTNVSRKNSDRSSTSTTASSYAYYEGAVQQSVTYRPDTGKNDSFTSTYSYDLLGRLTDVHIADGRTRDVHFVGDTAGQVLSRTESSSAAANPRNFYYYFNGIQLGQNGNNGNADPEFATAIIERTATPPTTPGAFRNGAAAPSAYANFDRSFDPVTPQGQQAGPQSHTVRAGETLQSIAAQTWGDASQWYLIAEANGLSGTSPLAAGQTLRIPDKLANTHNRTDTFRPYDPAEAIGDTQPTTPKPPKKPKCGVFGMILIAVVAIAVTVVSGGAFLAATGAVQGGLGAGIGAFVGGTAGLGAMVGAGIVGGAIGSLASQGLGIALGYQTSINWKGVALAAVGGGVSAGIGNIFPKELFGSKLVADVARAAVSNTITQGIGIVTGLQDSFSWTSVAVSAAASGLGGAVARGLASEHGILGITAGAGSFGNALVSGVAGGIAGAATKSLIDGTDFGDNVMATLPEVIGAAIGNLAAKSFGSWVADKPTIPDAYNELSRTRYASNTIRLPSWNGWGFGGPVMSDSGRREGDIIIVTARKSNDEPSFLDNVVGLITNNRIADSIRQHVNISGQIDRSGFSFRVNVSAGGYSLGLASDVRYRNGTFSSSGAVGVRAGSYSARASGAVRAGPGGVAGAVNANLRGPRISADFSASGAASDNALTARANLSAASGSSSLSAGAVLDVRDTPSGSRLSLSGNVAAQAGGLSARAGAGIVVTDTSLAAGGMVSVRAGGQSLTLQGGVAVANDSLALTGRSSGTIAGISSDVAGTTGVNNLTTRGLGLVQGVTGTIGAVGSGIAAVFTAPTVAGAVGFGGLAVIEADQAQAGFRTFWTGEQTNSFAAQGISSVTGIDPGYADVGLGLAGGVTSIGSAGKSLVRVSTRTGDAVSEGIDDGFRAFAKENAAESALPKAWSVGDDIYAVTAKGSDPAWSTVRGRFWKNEAANPQYGTWNAQQLERMQQGLAPQRYNFDKGGIESMDLSHEPIPFRNGGRDVVPRWPQDHAAVDPYRRPGY